MTGLPAYLVREALPHRFSPRVTWLKSRLPFGPCRLDEDDIVILGRGCESAHGLGAERHVT